MQDVNTSHALKNLHLVWQHVVESNTPPSDLQLTIGDVPHHGQADLQPPPPWLLSLVLLNAVWDVVSWACLLQTDAPEGSLAHRIAELHAGMWLAAESNAARATLGWLVLALGYARLAFVAEPTCRAAVISSYIAEALWVLGEVCAGRMQWGLKTGFTVFTSLLMWTLLLAL